MSNTATPSVTAEKPLSIAAPPSPILYYWRGRLERTVPTSPTLTLLDLLREQQRCYSAKEGCNEGDCGACAVVLAKPDAKGRLQFQAVNACIRLASSIHGCALWTAQDIGTFDAPHPVQQAMVQQGATQCGFCTPGFVMSLYALSEQKIAQGRAGSREEVVEALSGNLCRCTGYRSIVDAGCQAISWATLEPQAANAGERFLQGTMTERELIVALQTLSEQPHPMGLAATDLASFAKALSEVPDAQLVAGCTDVGLWINKSHAQYPSVLDITQVQDLQTIDTHEKGWMFGAACTVQAVFAALGAHYPTLRTFGERFAGRLVRNSATIGGNIANGSPIGDSMPLLLAMGAVLHLCRFDSSSKALQWREVALEHFYTGYRKNVLQAGEFIARVGVPKLGGAAATRDADHVLQAYKVSKRFEDDISAVCMAVYIQVDHAGTSQVEGSLVQSVRIGLGGVSATPVRAYRSEQTITGQVWSEQTRALLAQSLASEFTPIDDLRASAQYRLVVLANLVTRLDDALRGKSVQALT